MTNWEKWLWKKFSEYVRLRDCIKTTGTTWKGQCVTCGKIFRFNKLQAGHFIPGRTGAILFDEKCTHAQCYRCNVILDGVWPVYYKFMQKEYGQEVIEKLVDLWGVNATFDREWFEQSYKYYDYCVEQMRETQKLVA